MRIQVVNSWYESKIEACPLIYANRARLPVPPLRIACQNGHFSTQTGQFSRLIMIRLQSISSLTLRNNSNKWHYMRDLLWNYENPWRKLIGVDLTLKAGQTGISLVLSADGHSKEITQHNLEIPAWNLSPCGSFIGCAGRCGDNTLHRASAGRCAASQTRFNRAFNSKRDSNCTSTKEEDDR